MKFVHTIAILLTVACTGCASYTRTELPQIHGQIVDRHTSAPIANAAVTITGGTHRKLVVRAVTDSAGRFEVAEVTDQVWLPPLNWTIVVPDAEIDVSASGFEDRSINLYSLDGVYVVGQRVRPAAIRLSLRRADAESP